MNRQFTYQEVIDMVDSCGFPVAYDHFDEDDAPEPPFLIFRMPETNPLYADDTHYLEPIKLHLELYQRRKNPVEEGLVKTALLSNGLPFKRNEIWLGSEGLYEVLYETEILLSEEEE